MPMSEIWKDIDGFPLYQVSNQGQVRNRSSGCIRRLSMSNGYYHVDLYKNDGKRHGYTKQVHVLVAEAFLGKHPGLHVNHKDGDKTNNVVVNLEWVTPSENLQHAYDTGLRRPPGEKPILIKETGQIFNSISECARAINGDVQNISACLLGKRHSCNGYHFEYAEQRRKPILYDHQLEAVKKLKNGNILCGGVGSGKSRTSLFYYFKENGGWIDENGYVPMKKPRDLYIITTAMKRDTLEWEEELLPFLVTTHPNELYPGHKVIIDSWNNVKKYKDVFGAFFIFDEQRVVGSGAWVKSFLNITRKNKWILLSATPGDTWSDYIPVFIANGFYRNRTEFNNRHVVYSRFTKYPKIDRYIDTGILLKHRNDILVDMEFNRHTVPHHEDIYVDYDIFKYKEVGRLRWNPYTNKPIKNASELCYTWRKIVNSDDSRQVALLELFEKHPRMIIFYNFDYELDILKGIFESINVDVAEWNGHSHQPIPKSRSWIYLVQYTAGAEGWNSIKTDTIVFFSQNYSYKIMTQASGRIDRLNTPFTDLYYYHLKSKAPIDRAIGRALSAKKKFNETKFVKW